MEWKYDKIYSNKYEMMQAIEGEKSDGVYIGRYVLVNYDIVEDITNKPYKGEISSLEELNSLNLPIQIGDLYKATSNFNLIVNDGSPYEITNGDYLIAERHINSGSIGLSCNWLILKGNSELDEYFYGDTRTWHNTIWQKVINDGEEKYIFITDLNLVQNVQPNKILITDENNQIVLADNNENNDIIYVSKNEDNNLTKVEHKKATNGEFKLTIEKTSNSSETTYRLVYPNAVIDDYGHFCLDGTSKSIFEMNPDRLSAYLYEINDKGENQINRQLSFSVGAGESNVPNVVSSSVDQLHFDIEGEEIRYYTYPGGEGISLGGKGKAGSAYASFGEIFNDYNNNQAYNYCHAEGLNTVAGDIINHNYYTNAAHAEGEDTQALGSRSHAEGWKTIAGEKRINSHNLTSYYTEGSHAEGIETQALGNAAHSQGYNTIASGDYSFCGGVGELTTYKIGTIKQIKEDYILACSGKYFTLLNKQPTVLIDETAQILAKIDSIEQIAAGSISAYKIIFSSNLPEDFVSGSEYNVYFLNENNARASGSFTFGYNCQTYDNYSAAFGNHTISTKENSFACGQYNNYNSSAIFSVGIGSDNENRENGFIVNKSGTCYAKKTFNNGGADYAEYFKWQNTPNKKLQSLFVTLDEDKIRLATKDDDYILGIISTNPGVVGNSPIDSDRENDPGYAVVGLMGQIAVEDDGTCKPNRYCWSGENGIATASETGYRVMKRIDDNHILVMFR